MNLKVSSIWVAAAHVDCLYAYAHLFSVFYNMGGFILPETSRVK